jgi:hypothetical protein
VVGRAARRKDSVFPAQSWNSSHTRIGFFAFASAAAMRGAKTAGSASAEAIAEQNRMKSRRDRPRRSHSWESQVRPLPECSSMCTSGASARPVTASLESGATLLQEPAFLTDSATPCFDAHQFSENLACKSRILLFLRRTLALG